MIFKLPFILLPALSITSACSSTIPQEFTYTRLFNQGSVATSGLAAISFGSNDGSTSAVLGRIDRQSNRFSIGSDTGTISSDRTFVTLDAGGTIVLRPDQNNYVARFSSVSSSASPKFGVLGVTTFTADIPTGGAAVYTGNSEIQIIDNSLVYDLTGKATFFANFANSSVDISIQNLSGTSTNGLSLPSLVSNVATITAQRATISGNRFFGGSVDLSSAMLSRGLSGMEQSVVSGAFFGPSAVEIGGIVFVDDSANGTALIIQGTMISN